VVEGEQRERRCGSVTLRTMNAAELTPEQRARYGLTDWEPNS
jgi:hypothetical protein